ncbi:hypothetical protein [Timonella sp. A28]|uniref:hypothetical protein n=1 Tax=Timonella sp. A28 TaxID=3442640 RepID=UPI003EBDDCA6
MSEGSGVLKSGHASTTSQDFSPDGPPSCLAPTHPFTHENITVLGGSTSVAADIDALAASSQILNATMEPLLQAGNCMKEAAQRLEELWEQLKIEEAARAQRDLEHCIVRPAFPQIEDEAAFWELHRGCLTLAERAFTARENIYDISDVAFKAAKEYVSVQGKITNFFKDSDNWPPAFAPLNPFNGMTGRERAVQHVVNLKNSVNFFIPIKWMTLANAGYEKKVRGKEVLEISKTAGALFNLIKDRTYSVEPQDLKQVKAELPALESVPKVLEAFKEVRNTSKEAIAITETQNAAGETVYVVQIHGTVAATSFGGVDNPADSSSNGNSMYGETSTLADMVVAAMERQGIPAEAPVTLMGYSQGGIVAMQLTNSAAYKNKFNYAGVITASSPVAGFPTNPKIPTVHVENEKDWIPSLDTAENPIGAQRVTIRAHDDAIKDNAHNFDHNPQIAEAAVGNRAVDDVYAAIAKNLPTQGQQQSTSLYTKGDA